jgi:hypothetical protein
MGSGVGSAFSAATGSGAVTGSGATTGSSVATGGLAMSRSEVKVAVGVGVVRN